MYSNIIFDLDGTLIDSLPGISSALNASLEENKLPAQPTSSVRGFIGDGARTLCERAAVGHPESTIEALLESFQKHYTASWKTGTQVFEGVYELIKSLKKAGHTLSILSNKPHHFTTEIVHHFFPDHPFDLILGQRDGVEKKPDPSGVHELLGDLGQSSSRSILVGDSTIDVVTSRNAGIASAAVTWGFHDPKPLALSSPTHTATSLAELEAILCPARISNF